MRAILSHAAIFSCPECGARNIVEPVEVSRQQLLDEMRQAGCDVSAATQVTAWPGLVVCGACEREWGTELAFDED
jgi:hypothetical protein